MTIDRGLLDRIRTRGEEVFTQVSSELLKNPRFMQAVEGAMRGREKVEEAVGKALKQMNVPTRTDLKRALSRIETLEREVQSLKAGPKARPRKAEVGTSAGARPGARGQARVKAKPKAAAR